MLQLATLKTLKHICIILSIVAWSTFGTFGNSLTYDSAQYTIFLDIHDKNGIPVLNKDYVDSLRNQYTEDQDTVQLMFTHLASALISAEADVEGAIDQLLKASNLVEQSGRLELSPFLSLVEGQIYTLIGRYDDAKTHFIDANIAFRDQDIFMFLISKVYIADMLNKLDEPEESLITQNECLEILDDLKMTNTWIGQILELQLWEASNASYIMTGQLSMAEETLKKTIEMASELNQGNVLQNANGNLSFVYLQNGNYQKVLEYALPDLEYSLRMNRNKSVNGLAGVIAFTYMQLGIPDSSEKYIRMLIGYEKDFHNWTVLQNNLSTLLTYHKSKNQLDSAFNVISRYLVLIDSIVNSRKSQDYEFIQSEIKLRSATQKIENLTTLNEIKAQSIQYTALRILSSLKGGDSPGPESSMMKTLVTDLEQEISELTLEVIGYYGIAFQDTSLGTNEPAIGDEDYRAVAGKYQNLRATTIYGGSNEIQRNIMAKAVLGL